MRDFLREIFISHFRQRCYSDFGGFQKCADFLRKRVEVSTKMRKRLRKSAGDLAKCDGNFNQMHRGVKMGIRKRSKTFENIRKYSKSRVKRSKIFKNIQIFYRYLRI